jgi:hypothetical protein
VAKRNPDNASTSWQDISECVPAWCAEYGVRLEATIVWQPNLSSGAYVEVVLYSSMEVGRGAEVVRTRAPFPTRRGAGHAGAVLHAAFQAFQELETNPWLWPSDKRRAARGEG